MKKIVVLIMFLVLPACATVEKIVPTKYKADFDAVVADLEALRVAWCNYPDSLRDALRAEANRQNNEIVLKLMNGVKCG